MRYFVLPREGLSDDVRAALTRGLGLSLQDADACARHCRRYGIDDVADFCEELGEAQAALATARVLGAPIQVDWRGRLCYDVAPAPEDLVSEDLVPDDLVSDDGVDEADQKPWKDDAWLGALFGSPDRSPIGETVEDRSAS